MVANEPNLATAGVDAIGAMPAGSGRTRPIRRCSLEFDPMCIDQLSADQDAVRQVLLSSGCASVQLGCLVGLR